MNETAAVYVKVNAEDKRKAEAILRSLGVTPSKLIRMLYKQVILRNGIPFDISIPIAKQPNDQNGEFISEGIESGKKY